jgi:F0F1-type ATP synthase assembly protein I
MYYILKVLVSAILIVIISEISKRSSLMGGILASIPFLSVLAMIWMYVENKSAEGISELSTSIFWLVIPSLALFISLPIFLKKGLSFFPSLGISLLITVVCYYLMILILYKFGIKL